MQKPPLRRFLHKRFDLSKERYIEQRDRLKSHETDGNQELMEALAEITENEDDESEMKQKTSRKRKLRKLPSVKICMVFLKVLWLSLINLLARWIRFMMTLSG